MILPRSFPISLFVISSLLILLFLYSPKSEAIRDYPSQVFKSYSHLQSRNQIEHVTNITLGFQKIFAVGLPERSDKRDALALTSSLTGFMIDWVDGVRGETVPDKALPFGVDRVKLWENNLGSWRGHMNVVRTIVEQGISSALILEDDMDWDVRLKAQLRTIALGTRTFRFSSPSSTPSCAGSPYGDDWDVLWLGHCGEVFPETLEENIGKQSSDPDLLHISRKYTIQHDPTVPDPEHARGFQNFSATPNTRWVHVSGGPICTFAYALSLEGARKVLFDLSVDHLVGPFDNALAGLCRWGREKERLGMRCLSVTPPVFVHHKAKGYVMSDSDIQLVGGGGKGELRTVGTTENIVWSARRNVRELLLGGEMSSQFERG